MPVFGTYNDYGWIEGSKCPESGFTAVIHRKIWDNASKFWHKDNRKEHKSDWFDWRKALATHNIGDIYEGRLKRGWTDEDCLWWYLYGSLTESDYGAVFKGIITSEDSNFTGAPDNLSFLHRSEFVQEICKKIIAGEWTDKESGHLTKMVCLYDGQYLTGHYLCPSNQPHIEQSPLLQQRIKVLQLQMDLLQELKKR